MLTEAFLVAALALLVGLFTLAEMALLAARPSRLEQLAQGSRRARMALELVRQPEHFLATTPVFITLLQIAAGAIFAASIGTQIAAALDALEHPWPAPWNLATGLAVAISGITLINLLVGSLLPRRIALTDPERLVIALAIPMRMLEWLAMPFTRVLTSLAQASLKLLRLPTAMRSSVTEEDIRLLFAQGADQGVIDSHEHNMLNRVLRLGDRSVGSVMTPRTRIVWLDADAPLAETLQTMRATPCSRYPVHRGDEQEILGVLEVKHVIARGSAITRDDLVCGLSEPLYVPSTARALDLVEEFRDADMPLALVVDEYGQIEGLVTLNDLLATVVGRATASLDESAAGAIRQQEDGSWLLDGSVGVDDLRELLDVPVLPLEREHEFHTAAGLAMAGFGRIPQKGEQFVAGGHRFEVLDLDGARIRRLRVSRLD